MRSVGAIGRIGRLASMGGSAGSGNGLSISAPSTVLFADGDQPFSLDGVNAISFTDAQNPVVAVAADYYVNSIDGDNGNGGTSADQAFADIATMETAATGSGVAVGLARGSLWSETITDTALDNIKGYGQGPLPILDATAAAPTWTQPDAGTYPNVWSASIDHEMVATGTSRLIVLEDGIMLPRQTSIANVNSNAGSRYSPSDGALPSNDPATVYIHATGSGNPNSNGKTYLIAIRDRGVNLGDDATVQSVELRSGGHPNGALDVGRNASVSNVLLRDCGKHHMFMEGGGLAENVVAVAGDVPLGSDGGQSFFVAYDAAASGYSAQFTKCFSINGTAISQPANPISRNGLYAHGSASNFDEIIYQQCASIDLLSAADFSAGDTDQFTVHGCYSRGADKCFAVGGSDWSAAAEFLYNQAYLCQTGIFDLKPSGASVVTIRHNVVAPWNWGLSRWLLDANSNVTGTIEHNTFVAPAHYKFARCQGVVTHRYNLYIMSEAGSQNVIDLANGSTSDFNVYINLGAGQLKYTYNGTEYGSLAAYQAATGQEANSLEFLSATLGDIFSGTPTNGDFRINSGGTIGAQVAALGAGAQYHWNWNSGAVAAGPSEQWPVVPTTLALARQYVNHPARWDFYDDNDPAFDSYTLTMTIEASGTIDFDNTTYAAVTENSGADASGAIDVTGTLAQINALFADPEPVLDNWSSETLDMSMTITHDTTRRTASKTISVESLGALAITGLSPADDATGVAYDRSTFTATFNRNIQAGTGNVVLKLVGGAALETFNIATGVGDQGGSITISGADLIISPNVNLTDNTAHAIQIASTAIDSVALGTADSFAGIADDTTWSFTCEDTTPSLSAPLDASTGGATSSGAVTTDRADGTLYWIIDQSATPPSAAQVKAGNGQDGSPADDSGSQAVTATGSQGITGSGLTSGTTYYTYFMHESANGAQSAVSAADGFTTDDVTAPTVASSDPADDDTGVSIGSTIAITFSENIIFQYPGGSSFALRSNDGGWATVETFTPSSTTAATGDNGGSIAIVDDVLTITPGDDMAASTIHSPACDGSCLEDGAGNAFAGLADGDIQFTTGTASQELTATAVVDTAATAQYLTTDIDWTNASNATAEDANFASASVSSSLETRFIKLTVDADTFAIPSDARIDGIKIDYRADTPDGSGTVFFEQDAYLVVGGEITGLNLFDTSNIVNPTTTTYSKGGATETWGVPLTPSAVNSAGFGIALRFERFGASSRTIRVYWAKITVYYTTAVGIATPPMAASWGMLPNNSNVISTHRFSFPGMGTPSAILVYSGAINRNLLTTGGDTTASFSTLQLIMSAALSSTNRYAGYGESVDNTYAGVRTAISTHVSENNGSLVVDVNAIGSGYVDLDFNNSGNPMILMVVGIFASNAHLQLQDGLDGSTGETSVVNAGFEPDLLILLGANERIDSGSHNQYMAWDMGFAVNDGAGGFNQYNALVNNKYKQNASDLTDLENMSRVGSDRLHTNINSGDSPTDIEYYWTVGSPTSTGYTITSAGGDGSAEDAAAVLALKFSGASIQAGIFDTPTSTGDVTFGDSNFAPDIGFTPSFMLKYWTLATAINSLEKHTSKGDMLAVSVSQPAMMASLGVCNENGQNPVNAQGYMARNSLLAKYGDQTSAFAATFGGFATGGYNANFTAADGTARKGLFLAIA